MRNLCICFLLAECLLVATATTAALVPEPSKRILAATHPLHQDIEILKDQLEKMEAKHDTLEAATEQFRLKAKSMKDELDKERWRYRELMLTTTDIEKHHNDEIASFQSKLWDADIEISKIKEKLEFSTTENNRLGSSLRERDREMSAVQSENTQLHQEVMLIKKHIEDMKRKGTSILWFAVTESELGSTIVELCEEYWDWFQENCSSLIQRFSLRFAALQEHSISLFRRTMEQPHDTADQPEPRHIIASKHTREKAGGISEDIIKEVYTSLLRSVTGTWDEFCLAASIFWQQAAVRLPHDMLVDGHLVLMKGFFSKFSVTHKAMALSLEWLVVALASYYITNLGGSHYHWLYSACMSLKSHSGLIIILIDVALGLLLLEIALIAFNNGADSVRRAREMATFRKEVFAPLNGATPTTSLLRTSLRSINRSGESDSSSG